MNRIIFCLALFLIAGFSGKAAAAAQPHVRGIQAPVGVVYDREGALYVAEWGADQVSRFDDKGGRTVVTAEVRSPAGLAFDDKGTLYVASYADGNIYALNSGEKPRRIASGLASPTGMVWDGDALLVANRNAGEIIRVRADGGKDVVSKGHKTPVGVVRLANNDLVVSCYGGSLDRVSPGGKVTSLTSNLNTPGVGIMADGENAVLVVDYGGSTVQRVTLDGKSATVADGLRSPVGLGRTPDGSIIVGTWSDNAAFIFPPYTKKEQQ